MDGGSWKRQTILCSRNDGSREYNKRGEMNNERNETYVQNSGRDR